MIALAMETADRHGRPTCSECTPDLQQRRGCKRPGFDMEQRGACFVYTSPMLQDDGWKRIYECPVGKVLRDGPWVFDVLDRAGYADGLSVSDYAGLPRFMQHAVRLVSSERARLRELRDIERKSLADSRYGMKVRGG